jgi:hypothetical protein
MSDLSITDAPPAGGQLVPAGFAEKAMASLMQLHSELMEEKEKRVDLYRRLQEREQALAELKMYVKLLEERASAARPSDAPSARSAEVPPAAQPRPSAPNRTEPARAAPRGPISVVVRPPVPPRVGRPLDGWKTW